MVDTSKKMPNVAPNILLWYRANHRDLPWRHTSDPYAIWVSEIMLQQTRAEAVKPYYHAFLQALPTVEALAEVEEDVLGKLWQGLGYYSRARNLKKAAREVCERFGGGLPKTRDELITLSGIGSYTAGAIASIAFGEAVPAVDGNVLRVLSRLLGDERDISDPRRKAEYEALLSPIIPVGDAGDFNQGMIELGATLCGPNSAPRCEACPLKEECVAHRDGATDRIPYRAPKNKRRKEKRTVLFLTDGVGYLIHQRKNEGLLASLYEFPSLDGEPTPNEIYRQLLLWGLLPEAVEEMPPFTHIFTHIEWHMSPLYIKVPTLGDGKERKIAYNTPYTTPMGGEGPQTGDEVYIWADAEALEGKYPIPSAFRPLTKQVKKK